jgi:hypothetical protein
MNHGILTEAVVKIFNELQTMEINSDKITCDDANDQVKALDCEDPSPIHRQNRETEHLSKLVFVPCRGCRPNNA